MARIKLGRGKFCCKKCKNEYQVNRHPSEKTIKKLREKLTGRVSPMKGRKHKNQSKCKIRENAKIGEKHRHWKGNDVSYNGLHKWIRRWKGSSDVCEMCGKSGLTGRQIDWANIDHKYRRVLDDYIRLCASCHGKYDKEHKLRKHNEH